MIILALAIIGGWISRMMGGGWPNIPHVPPQWIYAIPYGVLFYGSPWWAITAYVTAAIGARTAHYPYILMGELMKVDKRRVPPLDFVIRPIFGAISPNGGQYWRCVAGLAVTGMACTIFPGILYGLKIDPLGGAVIAISGALKPIGYMIGKVLRKNGIYSQENTLGEFLRGFSGWGSIAWVLF